MNPSVNPAEKTRAPLLRKVCGMRERENILAMLELKPDYLGFIFYPPSSRYVGQELDEALLRLLPAETKKVGVFVNAEEEQIKAEVEKYELQAVQLHGEESPELCRKLRDQGLTVFKAFAIDDDFDFDTLEPFEGSVDFFLFDTKGPKYGGNGRAFNWEVLQRYAGSTPFFLSGGIGPEHAQQIGKLDFPGLRGLDLNSRFETAPALKDVSQVANFFEHLGH
ncbi:MAG: phosphoribosylanthranilate isomerase [Adhaeribacter sp.]